MKLQLKVVAVCINFILYVGCGLCEELLDGSNMLRWTCICSSALVGRDNYHPASNCSTSCRCTPRGDTEEGWTCFCSPQQVPQQSSIYDVSCFNSCNCTYGLPNASSAKKHMPSKGIVIIILLCGILTATILTLAVAWYFSRRSRCHMQSQISSDRDISWNSTTNMLSRQTAFFPDYHDSNPITGCIWRASIIFRRKRQTLFTCIIQFSYVELELATNKFSKENLIGIGGSSNVFHGRLKDGKLVAVKKLKLVGGSDTDSEFLTEIELISRLNHRHVVPLLGYCIEYQGKQVERLLVFEYMPNGNLRECLDASKGKDSLDWVTRVKIALGVARGLEYLHEAAAPRILHRDIKSTNILLDDKYTAKITDLGMAKRLMADDFVSCTNSPARMLGTFGYFAPEYAIVGKASLKSDVFSFGVVILELITGRHPIHKSTNKGDESLVIWAAARMCNSKLVVSELPDPLLKGNFAEEEMQMMAHLARECLHWDPDSRPTMSEVVQILSAVASDKVHRRNLSANFLMGPSSCSIRRNTTPSSVLQGYEDLQEVCLQKVEVGEFKEHDERVFCNGRTDGLMLLTSRPQNSHPLEDEIVDITEPRFESFVQENIRVSVSQVSP